MDEEYTASYGAQKKYQCFGCSMKVNAILITPFQCNLVAKTNSDMDEERTTLYGATKKVFGI